eukprot:5853667-Prymnesium_polylepis.1
MPAAAVAISHAAMSRSATRAPARSRVIAVWVCQDAAQELQLPVGSPTALVHPALPSVKQASETIDCARRMTINSQMGSEA